jgi:arginine deiminase
MVHRPDLAHERPSPSNAHELLFDDVIRVRRAHEEHDVFVDLMRGRGVEVVLSSVQRRELTLEEISLHSGTWCCLAGQNE